MDVADDLLKRGFHLAHFIVPDRLRAIQILADSTSKLEVHRRQEKKRTYWRHKHLKRKITRVIRQDSDMLQWLIYFEAEKHEREQELAGQSTGDDLVIHYVKYLAQITTPMSSFYVNIGFQRLLHSYSTSETRSIYEWMTDHFPGDEEYRKVKAALMNKLLVRFGNFLRTRQISRGELRFETEDRLDCFIELVQQCLSVFTPWSTSQACGALAGSSGDGIRERIPGIPGKSNLDAVESYRSHIFIHPPCLEGLTRTVGLESPQQRILVPRFFLSTNGDNQRGPSTTRKPNGDLTEQERFAIVSRLDREQIHRQEIRAGRLRVLVDGLQCLEVDLSRQNSARCGLPADAKLIEFWTADKAENVLLATHWIDYSGPNTPDDAESVVQIGKSRSVSLMIVSDTSTATLLLEFHPSSLLARLGSPFGRSVWTQFSPKYAIAMASCLVLGALVASIAYRKQEARQDAIVASMRNELAQERASRAKVQQQLADSMSQATASFRLVEDGDRTRGLQSQYQQHFVLPANAAIVHLELPVSSPARSRYRATLKLFAENKTILEEDYLTPTNAGDNPAVTLYISGSLLKTNEYYEIILSTMDKNGTQKDSHTFTFYLDKK
jgi:hypothetical protein